MAGSKGLYRIFLMNLAGKDTDTRGDEEASNPLLRAARAASQWETDHAKIPIKWNNDAFNDVGNKLQAHFQRVIAHPACPFTSVRWFPGSPGMTLDPGELLVYFVASYRSSVIEDAGGKLKDTTFMKEGGATWDSPDGMISEVWLDGSPLRAAKPLSNADYQQALANVAFHELMHNKLDTSNTHAVKDINDIHFDAGGGLADPNHTALTILTARNIELMAQNLATPIRQNTAVAPRSMLVMDGMPVYIDNGNGPHWAPTP